MEEFFNIVQDFVPFMRKVAPCYIYIPAKILFTYRGLRKLGNLAADKWSPDLRNHAAYENKREKELGI